MAAALLKEKEAEEKKQAEEENKKKKEEEKKQLSDAIRKVQLSTYLSYLSSYLPTYPSI